MNKIIICKIRTYRNPFSTTNIVTQTQFCFLWLQNREQTPFMARHLTFEIPFKDLSKVSKFLAYRDESTRDIFLWSFWQQRRHHLYPCWRILEDPRQPPKVQIIFAACLQLARFPQSIIYFLDLKLRLIMYMRLRAFIRPQWGAWTRFISWWVALWIHLSSRYWMSRWTTLSIMVPSLWLLWLGLGYF